MDHIIQEIKEAVISGQQKVVQEKVPQALDSGINPAIILNQGLMAAMDEVGLQFEKGEFFVPEMLIAARAMQTGLAFLKPHLQKTNVKATGKVAIGTVHGDLHDIGKNLVAMMLEGAGFEIIDLGTDVSPDKFVETVQIEHPDIVGLSALLTTTMVNMRMTIEALEQAGVRESVKVIIGGAPVTEEFAQQIGADGHAPDASQAVKLARTLVQI
jgi:5-methyltetrahydrofolate--homocysteine methyltransferase